MTGVSQIATGFDYALALAGDGSVVGWGSNASGGLSIPAGLGNVVGLSAQATLSIALKSDGTVVTWGNAVLAPPPVGLANVVQVSAGANHWARAHRRSHRGGVGQ